MKKAPKVSIVMPAYNEEKRIGITLEKYLEYFRQIKKEKKISDFEIVVVLNGCRDNTLEVVKKYQSKELKVLNFKQAGKGFAITEGFKDALKRDSDLIGFVDADLATPSEAFYDLIKNLGDFDGVIPNRWDKKSVIFPKRTLKRKIFSMGYNFGIRAIFLFNFRDTQCGAKLFRREIVEKIIPYIGSSAWGFDVDLLFYAKKNGAKIKSIPTVWEDRRGSHIIGAKIPITMALSAIRLRLIHSPFKFIVKLYGKLPSRFHIYRENQSLNTEKIKR